MRKLSGIAIAVAVILAAAVLTGATPVTPIPFKTYDEVSAALVDGGPAGKCSGELAFASTLEGQVRTWAGLVKFAPVPGSPDGFAACDILNPVTAKGV